MESEDCVGASTWREQMTRTLAVCVISVGCWITPLRAQISIDLVREAQMQERALLDRTAEQQREQQFQQGLRQKQFEAKFNQLVEAIASFSREYKKSKGAIWPQREADKLRKALHELQASEKSLREDTKRARAQ